MLDAPGAFSTTLREFKKTNRVEKKGSDETMEQNDRNRRVRRSRTVSLILAIPLCALAIAVDRERAEGAPSDPESKVYHFGNEFCPVMGEPVNTEAFVEYQDKEHSVFGRIYICCAGCDKKIEKELPRLYKTFYRRDPRTGKEIGPLDLKNTECPVSGKAVVAEATVEYNGFCVGLCCRDCVESFLKDPDAKLEELVPNLKDYEFEP
jgi:hypothetical protein